MHELERAVTAARQEKTDDFSTPERLIETAAALWAQEGRAGVATRAIVARSGLPNSSIYHHFGGLEQLLLETQAHVRRRAGIWCEQQLASAARLSTLSPAAFPTLFATLVDDWCWQQRQMAFILRECHLVGRNARYLSVLEEWRILWLDFWEALAARCGFARAGMICSNVFDGVSLLHLMDWRRLVDRASLDEYARGLGAWLTGELADEGPWHRSAHEEALRTQPRLERRGVAGDIANAAANVLERSGMAGLTYRAVAAEAGVTLGTVSHQFRSASDLLHATFETIYDRISPPGAALPVAADAGTAEARRTAPIYFATEELILSVARRSDLGAFALQLRYLRGRGGRPLLMQRLKRDDVSLVDGLLYSSFLAGHGRAMFSIEEGEQRAAAADVPGALLGLLGSPDAATRAG